MNAVNDGRCFWWDRSGHFSKDLHFPARKDNCHKCGHTGHWAIACKTKEPGDKNEKGNKPGNKGGAGKGKKKSIMSMTMKVMTNMHFRRIMPLKIGR